MLTIRTANPNDAPEVATLHVRSWQAAYRGLLPDEYLDSLRPEDRAARYTFGAADPNRPSTLLAIENDAIVGFSTTGTSRDATVPDAGEILALYVAPAAWGLGVGRRLIAEARARLRERGFTQAVLWVLAGNERAERFYRIDGWSPDGRLRKEEIGGVVVDEIGYRCRLCDRPPPLRSPA